MVVNPRALAIPRVGRSRVTPAPRVSAARAADPAAPVLRGRARWTTTWPPGSRRRRSPARRVRSRAPPPASRAFGAAAVGARAPATPATPAGQRVFGVDANAPPKTAFATDAFLRLVPATARPATARPATARRRSSARRADDIAPTPTKIDDDDDDGDSEDERADAMDADGSPRQRAARGVRLRGRRPRGGDGRDDPRGRAGGV